MSDHPNSNPGSVEMSPDSPTQVAMSDERLAELERAADTDCPNYFPQADVLELVAEVRRSWGLVSGLVAEREEARNDAKKLANQRDEAHAQLTEAQRLRNLWFNENSAAQAALGRVREAVGDIEAMHKETWYDCCGCSAYDDIIAAAAVKVRRALEGEG